MMIPLKLPIMLIIVLLCAIAASGCTSSTTELSSGMAFPVTLTDDLGRTVTFNGTPQRIVSLAPSNTEILFALGLGDRVVGVDAYSNYPEAARSKPKMGGMINVSEADVVAARPDLVLVGQFTPRSAVDNLSAAGLKCVSAHPDNASETYRIIILLGDLCGVPDRARNLSARLETEVARVTGVTSRLNNSSKPTVLMIITSGNESYVADQAGYMGDLITMAGGRNLATGPVMTPAEIAEANPDVIIVPLTDWTVTTLDSLRNGSEPWMRSLKAVKNGNVFDVDYDIVGRPGPRIGEAAAAMLRVIHPEMHANNTG